MFDQRRVVAIIPALNEAQSIALVLTELRDVLNSEHTAIVDEVIVCDNGSSDSTASIARKHGARVVTEKERGYGAACLKALEDYWRRPHNFDDILIFVDADHSVKIDELPKLLSPMVAGADLVIGDRTRGNSEGGALTPQQKFGNWLAAGLIRIIWKQPVHDLGPFRAIRSDAIIALGMEDRAFGWTCEMQVKAIQDHMKIVEVPTSSLRRIGTSKISGTLIGSLKAGHGIFSMVWRLWRREALEKNMAITQSR